MIHTTTTPDRLLQSDPVFLRRRPDLIRVARRPPPNAPTAGEVALTIRDQPRRLDCFLTWALEAKV